MGSAWVADRLWERLGIARAIIEAAGGRRLAAEGVERTIFAMVANRMSVKPLSKLAGCSWVAERAFIEGLAAVSVTMPATRAMDFLHAALPELQERVFFCVASLLDLEVELLFFDTSSTYWETDRLPEELQTKVTRRSPSSTRSTSFALRARPAHLVEEQKDHRPDLPQVVVGMGGHPQGDPGQGVDVPRQRV